MRRTLALIAVLALAIALVANPLPAGASPKKVTIKGSLGLYHFKPGTVTIKKGHKVSWSWNSDAPHNVTFGKKLNKRHSKTKSSLSDFTITFKKTGTFKYHCTVHGFSGKVVVTN